jgi:hypothetical protein
MGPVPGCHAGVEQMTQSKDGESIWWFIVQSGSVYRLVALSLLLAACSASYIAAVERRANSSRIGHAVDDRRAILVTGDIDQQRAAVLANFARYNND